MTELGTYLDALYGAEPPSSYVELRHRLPAGRGMGQEFFPVRDRYRVVGTIEDRSRDTDIYIGVAPRRECAGGRDAIERVHALWADVDERDALARLERFNPSPSIVVGSGSGRHVYWALWPPAAPDDAERANRRLAHALRADMQATDAARILRPPGSFNFKTGQPVPVSIEHLDGEAVYRIEQVAGSLADPPRSTRAVRTVEPLRSDGDPLAAIPPVVYVEALTGREVGRDGKVVCPFHEDRTPSLHIYDEPERGWTCFGCGRGGTIIDFGAALYGIEPRGVGFHELRQRLARELLRTAA